VWWPGGLLIGLSTFQGEFDFGVPQFQLIYHPLLIMLAAGVGLVAARVWLGPGRALGAVAFFIAMRGLLALGVHDSLGQSLPHFPLYIAEALLVEGAALVVSPKRPLAFGAVAGALIGTVGLAAEWGWTHIWSPLPWPVALAPEGILLGFAMALAGACVGAWLGARLSQDRTPSLRPAGVVAATAIFAMTAYGLISSGDQGVRATVALSPHGTATVRVDPPAGADDANWLTATAWQGGGLVVDRLERTAPGVYRSTQPLPLDGDWKTMIRLHRGDALTALPVYLPADPAIPVGGVPARPQVERAFGDERKLLQRERKTAAGWLWGTAYGIVLLIALGFLASLAWGVHRVSVLGDEPRTPRFTSTARRPAEHEHVH
jgi:hypothetical protein